MRFCFDGRRRVRFTTLHSGELHTDQPGRHDDDAVTQNHCHGRYELSQAGLWRDVSISHGGDGDDGPVDASGDIVESTVGLGALDDVHHRAQNHRQCNDEDEKDRNAVSRVLQSGQHILRLTGIGVQAQYAENAKYAKDAHDAEEAPATKEEPQIPRQDGQEVDDPKEAQHIASRLASTE